MQNKAEGETAVFHCEAGGKPPPKQYWIYNGMPITEELHNPRRIVDTNKITIYNLTKADTGNYGCNATNGHGYVYKDVYVNVLGKFIDFDVHQMLPVIWLALVAVGSITVKKVKRLLYFLLMFLVFGLFTVHSSIIWWLPGILKHHTSPQKTLFILVSPSFSIFTNT